MKTWLLEFWNKSKGTIFKICLVLVVLSIAYIAGRCSTRKERINQNNNIIALNTEIKDYSVTIEGLKNSVHEQKAIILSQEDAIKAGLVREDVLKKLHIKDLITYTDLVGQIHKRDSLLSLPPNTIFITVKDTSGQPHNYLQVPFLLLNIREEFLKLTAGMDINKKPYYDMITPFKGSIAIGYKRQGLFKPTVPVGSFVSKNPYIQMNNMNVTIVQEPKKWYEKTWVHILIGGGIVEGINILANRK